MSEDHLWFGFLDAGAKSSPVVLDRNLDTGNPKTVYLFNLARNEFVEYQRAIVEAKLRDLKPGEASIDTLKSAFGQARSGFMPRGHKPLEIPDSGPSSVPDDDSSFEADLEAMIDGREAVDDDEPDDWGDEEDTESEEENESSYE